MSYNEKQVQIIETAEELFANKGFSGTSVRDIAQAANVNLAMISYYFGSKEKLLEAIFESRIQSTALQVESLLQNDRIHPILKIYTLIDLYTEKLFNNQCFYRLMLREQIKQLENPGLQEIIYQSKKKNYDLVTALIQQGQEKGIFRSKIDTSLMVSTMIGTANQIFFNQFFYKKMHSYEAMPQDEFESMLRRIIRHHLKFMFKSILTNAA